MEPDITDEEIRALWAVLREEMDPAAYMARVGDFTDVEIQAGALRAADEEADRKNLDLYRRALAAAWTARENTHCAEEGCGHPRYQHSGRGGRCVEGKQKDTAAWRCDCHGFVAPDLS